MMALAFLVGATCAARYARERGMDGERIFNAAFLAVIAGVIGARAWYVFTHSELYRRHYLEIFILPHGGLSWFGGFFLGAAAVVWYLRRARIPLLPALDVLAPCVALAQAIGRIGCLLNGCCYGKHADWGLYFPVLNDRLIPTQLFSALALVGIFIVLRVLQKRRMPAGNVFFAYLGLYGTKRFVMEFLRADNPPVAAGLTQFQWCSIVLIVCAGVWFVMRRVRR
jgi:phosphatidylglycerol:prolipoprotein diacylglycerol transferase